MEDFQMVVAMVRKQYVYQGYIKVQEDSLQWETRLNKRPHPLRPRSA